MKQFGRNNRFRSTTLISIALASVLAAAACSSGATAPASQASSTSAAAAPASSTGGSAASPQKTKLKVCMAIGGHDADWEPAQGQVAAALAKQRGWDYVELNNNGDGPTANKNADVFIQDKCSAVIMFNGVPSVNPVMAAKYAAAKIPVITYDIAQKGWYFVGIDNEKAGKLGGAALGEIAKTKWNCNVDLVMSAEQSVAGVVNTQRTGGMRDGVKSVCPNIAASKYVSFESNGQANVGLPKARALLSAHPDAKNILAVGINDGGVLGALQAAEQLNRASNIIGWGQDGTYITGDNVNPHLAGSVLYFLEGYATYAFSEILDKIASGNPPPMADYTNNNPAVLIAPCPVTQAQAAKIPDLPARVTKLIAAPAGTSSLDLFCPKS